jgi:hypothetical protein
MKHCGKSLVFRSANSRPLEGSISICLDGETEGTQTVSTLKTGIEAFEAASSAARDDERDGCCSDVLVKAFWRSISS